MQSEIEACFTRCNVIRYNFSLKTRNRRDRFMASCKYFLVSLVITIYQDKTCIIEYVYLDVYEEVPSSPHVPLCLHSNNHQFVLSWRCLEKSSKLSKPRQQMKFISIINFYRFNFGLIPSHFCPKIYIHFGTYEIHSMVIIPLPFMICICCSCNLIRSQVIHSCMKME